MKVAKQSNRSQIPEELEGIGDYIISLDQDMQNLVNLSQSRIRFGSGSDGAKGENISGCFQVYTSNAVADTEDTLAHTLGAIPIGYLVLYQDKAGSVYQGPTTGTNWTNSNVYLKCDTADVTFLLFLIK